MISLVLAAAISWPVRYNDGVAAYRSNEFASATTAFEQATASVDRVLQERAYYNLGNTAYRLGQADPTKSQPLWERAIKNYDSALAIDPKDEDAKFNRDLVRKKLDELQKQKEQQQEQDKQQQQDNQKQNKQDQQDKKQQQDGQQQKQPQEQRREEQPQGGRGRPENKDEAQPQQTSEPHNLDKQQAAVLLDNLREEERNWNFFPELQMKDLKDSGEPGKDW